jgi:hypothetical protein
MLGLLAALPFFAIEIPRIMAFAPGLFALIGLVALIAVQRQRLTPPYTALYFILPLILLSGISVLWSISPETSINRALKFTPVFLLGLIHFIGRAPYKKKPPINIFFYYRRASFSGAYSLYLN